MGSFVVLKNVFLGGANAGANHPWCLQTDVARIRGQAMLVQLTSWVESTATAPSPVCPSCKQPGVPSRDNPDVTIIGLDFVFPGV